MKILFKRSLVYAILACLVPTSAYAYLDPASGNALIYLIVSLLAGAAYTIKGFYYKLVGKSNAIGEGTLSTASIALLSEGSLYWSTFEPIVKELIRRKQTFAYYTLDVNDPALCIDNEFMYSKFLGNGSWGLSKACKIQNPIVLSTTPNIGTEGYPVLRSPFTKNLIHIFHSVLDIADYHKGSLDNYDTVYLVGDFQAASIREIEAKRNLPKKKLKTLGLPYFDLMGNSLGTCSTKQQKKTILIAPSWGEKSCLAVLGVGFIHELAQERYDIIVRPHPQSYRVEKDFIERLEEELAMHANVHWDSNISGAESLSQADCMISDVSSVRFDFAFFYKKPVITIELPQEDMRGYELEDLDSTNLNSMNEMIGCGIAKDEIASITSMVEQMLNSFTPDKIDELQKKNVTNFLSASNAICEELVKEVAKQPAA
jgi:hypothetical protein